MIILNSVNVSSFGIDKTKNDLMINMLKLANENSINGYMIVSMQGKNIIDSTNPNTLYVKPNYKNKITKRQYCYRSRNGLFLHTDLLSSIMYYKNRIMFNGYRYNMPFAIDDLTTNDFSIVQNYKIFKAQILLEDIIVAIDRTYHNPFVELINGMFLVSNIATITDRNVIDIFQEVKRLALSDIQQPVQEHDDI